MRQIILIGGGGHCRSVIDVIESQNKFKIAGIVDKSKLKNFKVLGYPIIGNDLDLKILAKKYKNAVITLGHIKSATSRQRLFNLAIQAGFRMPSIISPNAHVSKRSVIGKGTVVMHGAIINSNSSIGENCIINSKALIEHDCTIFKHCHISTNTTINGGTIIEKGCFVGSGSTTKEYIKIRKNTFIKAATLVK